MATLPSLRPNSDVLTNANIVDASVNVPTQYWAEVNDDPDGGAVGGLLQNLDDSIGTATIHLGLTETPLDFLSMDSVTARVYIEALNYVDDQGVLDVFISHDTLGALTDTITIYDFAVDGNTSGAFDAAFTLTSAGQSASKSDWDSAYIGLTWTNNKNMANDDGKTRVYGIEVNGEFTQTPPAPNLNASASMTTLAWATTTATASLSSTASVVATGFLEQSSSAPISAMSAMFPDGIGVAVVSPSFAASASFNPTISSQTFFFSASPTSQASQSVSASATTYASAFLESNAYSAGIGTIERFIESSVAAESSITVSGIQYIIAGAGLSAVAIFAPTISPQTMYSSASISAEAQASGFGTRGYTYQGYDFGYFRSFDVINGVVDLSATSELGVLTKLTRFVSIGFSATASFTPTGAVVFYASASLSSSSETTIVGQTATAGESSLGAQSTAAATAGVYAYGSIGLTAESSIDSAGVVIKLSSAALIAAASLDAKDDSTHLVPVSFSAQASLSGSSYLVWLSQLSLSATATLSSIVRETIYAYSFFILPQEGTSQLAFQGFHGDAIYTTAVGGDVFIDIGSQQSPALDPNYWHYVLLNDQTWSIEQLDESTHDGLLVQNVGMFSEVLTTTQVEDLLSVATTGAIVRVVDDTTGITINDGGATGLSTNWHRRKVT